MDELIMFRINTQIWPVASGRLSLVDRSNNNLDTFSARYSLKGCFIISMFRKPRGGDLIIFAGSVFRPPASMARQGVPGRRRFFFGRGTTVLPFWAN
jgi:hypothetical protein